MHSFICAYVHGAHSTVVELSSHEIFDLVDRRAGEWTVELALI